VCHLLGDGSGVGVLRRRLASSGARVLCRVSGWVGGDGWYGNQCILGRVVLEAWLVMGVLLYKSAIFTDDIHDTPCLILPRVYCFL
jgi:hypothetical protein